MENKTITIGKFILSKEEISISRKWYRKEQFIAWDNVQRIGRDKNALKIWYSSQTGKIKAISVAYEGKYKKLLDYWRNLLVEDLAAKGEICGSSLHERWLGIIVIIGLIPLGFFGYHLFIIISSLLKWCMYGWPEIQQITKWFLYYLVVPIGFFLAYPLSFLISNLRQTHIIGRWKSWKITKDGLFVQNELGRWKKMIFKPGDRISPDNIIVGGEHLPLACNLGGKGGGSIGGLTKNVVVPYLLGILAKRQGISSMPGKRNYPLAAALRLIFFWPFAITLLWYGPTLFWEVPESLDLPIRLTLLIIFGSCIAAGIGVLIAYFVENASYRKKFPEFIAQMGAIQQKLGW